MSRFIKVLPQGALLAALSLLSSCGGDDHCYNCGYIPSTPSYPSEVSLGLAAGNFNGNGHTSVIGTSTIEYHSFGNPGYLQSYLSTGAGTFAAPALTAAGNDPLYLASADLNGDGLPDVVSASYDDGDLEVFLSNTGSPGSFRTPIILASQGASQLAIGDMNNDGLPDIVSADFNVSLFLQTAPGVFAAPVTLYSGGANWVAVGDLNHDGIADIALADATGVKVLMHTGAASASTYAAPITMFTQTANAHLSGANVVAIADVNGDGYDDLIITDPGPTGGAMPTVSVLLQNAASPGTFLTPVSYAIAPQSLVQSIVVTDVNGDGHPDIVIGGSNAVTVLLQDTATPGTFGAASIYPASNANEIAVADVNGDGFPDIITATGATQPLVNGIYTNTPGVLLQSATTRGTFGALENLP
ncbi:MAG: VCBS repeat-containing protein [Steroidobacteraceae bacterium]